MYISTLEMSELTGASLRQLDYWRTKGIIDRHCSRVGEGTGHPLHWNENGVAIITLLAKIAHTSHVGVPLDLLLEVDYAYSKGLSRIVLSKGIYLSWEMDQIGAT